MDRFLMEEIVPYVQYLFDNTVEITSERVVGYSFDQFAGMASWDRFALASVDGE